MRLTCVLMLLLVCGAAAGQTDWNAIARENDEISRRIQEQQRQSEEINRMGYEMQQQQEAQNQQNQQDGQQIQQRYDAPQQQWVDSHGAVAFANDIKDGWIAVNFRSQQLAEDAALAACRAQVDFSDCKIGSSVINGALAIARDTGGGLVSQWGKDMVDARSNISAFCEKEKRVCSTLRAVPSDSWLESGQALNKSLVVPPAEADVRNHFAVVVWCVGCSDPEIDSSVWYSGGHTTQSAAQAVALDRCQQDVGAAEKDKCTVATWVANGYVAMASDSLNEIRQSVEFTEDAASARIAKFCATAKVDCTPLGNISSDIAKTERLRFQLRPLAWLGASYERPIKPELAEQHGLNADAVSLVTDVIAGGPAEAAGLKVGDIITRLDRQMFSESKSLSQIVQRAGIGKTIEIELMREGKEQQLQATLVQRAN